MSQSMFHRESCAGCREAVGEALTAARVGRALSIVNPIRSAETVYLVEGNTGRIRYRRGTAGLRGVQDLKARTYVRHRDLGGLRVVPAECGRDRRGKAVSRSRGCTTRRSQTRA